MERSTQQIQKLKNERAENEVKIEQLTHQNERLKAREQYLAKKERDGRTHRLCITGGIVETILPEISKGQLERNEKRIAELKRLFIKIYEDNARGKLDDERYDMMSQNYDIEQKQLEAEVIALRKEIEVQERQNDNVEKFIETAKRYVGIDTVEPYALRELVQAIYVDTPDKSSGKRRQNIHIKYDGIGFIPLNELMQKKTA